MFKSILRDRTLLFLLSFSLVIKLFSLNEIWVERYYTNGFYPLVSKTLRTILGWIPFSIGDLLYMIAGIWLVAKVWTLLKLLQRRQVKQSISWLLLRKYLKLVLLIYIVFSISWGLNYYRQGISNQIGISLQPYSVSDLFTLTARLQQRLNFYAATIDSLERLAYDKNDFLFAKAKKSYQNIHEKYTFLRYSPSSLKPSLYTAAGHWFGFTGYYNPFSAEAQIKTSIPVFLKPFVITHEIAHQLGYAKENEASFVAYLTCKNSTDVYFLYSAYFEMYRDALFDCFTTPNTKGAVQYKMAQHPRVTMDIFELRQYNTRNKNFIEPVMSEVYDRYLKLNNQPKGKATYNEVIAYLIAYMKKYGEQAI